MRVVSNSTQEETREDRCFIFIFIFTFLLLIYILDKNVFCFYVFLPPLLADAQNFDYTAHVKDSFVLSWPGCLH